MNTSNHNSGGPVEKRASQGNNRLVQMMAVFFMLGGMQAATQFFAYRFQYQPQLGAHFNHIYAPWSIIDWADQWYFKYPDIFELSMSMGVVFSGVGLIVTLIVKMVADNSARPNSSLHGSARWADRTDIQAARLLPKKDSFFKKLFAKKSPQNDFVYVGAWQDERGVTHYLKHNGAEHVLCYAPTRSGKGVGLVIPTLLSWGQSAVITDLKGELWSVTAGWRKEHAGNKVIRFDPASPKGSACWNPLDEIRMQDGFEVGDVQNLATLMVDPDGRGLNDHWQKTSQALLVGVILHVLYRSRNEGTAATLPYVDAILSDPERDIGELWMEMATYPHVNGQNHPVVGSTARDMLDRPGEEAGSVLSSAKSYLTLYRDPLVAKNISRSDFSIRDLMHHEHPVSLYIVTQPNDKTRLRPLVRIMANMIVRKLADRLEFENGQPVAHYKHRLLLMLDEFPSLGKLEIFQESLAYIAGYGIKAYLVCQDINQLKSRETGYGHDEAISSNCHIQNAFPPNRIETAEHLSKLTGQTTVIKEQITTSGRRVGMMHGNVTRTMQEIQRPLLTPDECLRMLGPEKDENGRITKAGDMIIYVAGYPAIYGKQPLYFQDPVFSARAAIAAPLYSDKIVKQ
ncbi:type IV secretion system protein VirD4 [Nitrosomonas sp. Nm84]|uniref:type IV secretory system conjugative DNA transfer family protein n=1 Tax=Nitrosomonas sp. Nm84 TaxID=200124 RepID=UPI000D751284|nr:type IV secretory system conjugative DNA transfer family protein [Nitrosomonas sp. Nm84]PXW89114.1 type IV secretion system protein VirD4 [Nitrosomonas sp. Nm84]